MPHLQHTIFCCWALALSSLWLFFLLRWMHGGSWINDECWSIIMVLTCGGNCHSLIPVLRLWVGWEVLCSVLVLGLNSCFERGKLVHIFIGRTSLLLLCFAQGLRALLLLHWWEVDGDVLDGLLLMVDEMVVLCMSCFPPHWNMYFFMCICMFLMKD